MAVEMMKVPTQETLVTLVFRDPETGRVVRKGSHFWIYHNLDQYGVHDLQPAIDNWLLRVTDGDYSAEAFCEYLVDKDPILYVAMTEKKYRQMGGIPTWERHDTISLPKQANAPDEPNTKRENHSQEVRSFRIRETTIFALICLAISVVVWLARTWK